MCVMGRKKQGSYNLKQTIKFPNSWGQTWVNMTAACWQIWRVRLIWYPAGSTGEPIKDTYFMNFEVQGNTQRKSAWKKASECLCVGSRVSMFAWAMHFYALAERYPTPTTGRIVLITFFTLNTLLHFYIQLTLFTSLSSSPPSYTDHPLYGIIILSLNLIHPHSPSLSVDPGIAPCGVVVLWW